MVGKGLYTDCIYTFTYISFCPQYPHAGAGAEENGRVKDTPVNGALNDGLRSKTPSHVYDYIPALGPGNVLEYVLPSSPPSDASDIPVSDNAAYGVVSSFYHTGD